MWSTRELADIVGTTLKTVRHYHDIGLLAEPDRTANGYKQYGSMHLIRLLRIRRLVDLGMPLSSIAAMDESDAMAEQAFRRLEAELAASIERQQWAQAELAGILKNRSLAEMPPGFGAKEDIPESHRVLYLLYSRVFGEDAMAALREIHADPCQPGTEFETMPADATEDDRQRIADEMVPLVHQYFQEHPALRTALQDAPPGVATASSVLTDGLVTIYNPAQLDVLRRVGDALRGLRPQPEAPTDQAGSIQMLR